MVPQPPQPFEAPPPIATNGIAPSSISFDAPEPFLTWLSADWDDAAPLDLNDCKYTDIWALVALASLRLGERSRRPPMSIHTQGHSGPARFAHALGLYALTGEGDDPGKNEPQRSVRLTRVQRSSEIEVAANRMAELIVSGDASHNTRLAIRYVLVELLRNVLQHSKDPLGAVAAAQRMDATEWSSGHMIQLAVADAGIGIPRSLRRAHPHLVDYRQALERALLPHISGTFEEGLTGSFENAGLGLYMISEIARHTGGRMLIATTGTTLVLPPGSSTIPHTPRFLKPHGLGYPGTLVAVEIPKGAVQDYHALIQTIHRRAESITPKRVSGRWLTFGEPPEGTANSPLYNLREDTPSAMALATDMVIPTLLNRQPVALDFEGPELCTQSWLHALLFEAIRLAWALRVPIHIVRAEPAVREALRFLESYALGG